MAVTVDPASPLSMLGRRHESARLETILDQLPESSATLVVEGDTGIGKTTLLRWAAGRAGERSLRVLACQPAEAESGLAYGALADVLAGVDDEVMASLPGPQRRALDGVLMQSDSGPADPTNRAVPLAVGSVLRMLAHASSVLLLIDDAQWLDGASEQALRFVLRRLPARDVGVIAATSRPAAGGTLGLGEGLSGRAQRLRLGSLAPSYLGAVITERLGVVLSPPMLARVHGAAGGNPLFALELCRALLEAGSVDDPSAALRLTPRLHRAVGDRLAALTPQAQEVCLCAAATAHPGVHLLLTVTGSASWQSSGGAFAEQMGVLEVSEGVVSFTHPLMASAVLEAAAPAALRDVHRRLAAVCADPEDRAHHLAASSTGPDERTAALLDRAAARAWDRDAPSTAAELAERAISLTSAPTARNERILAASALHLEAANPTRAHALLRQVLDGEPTCAQRVEALAQIGSVRFDAQDPLECAALLEDALEHVDPDDHALRARVGMELAWAQLFAGDREATLAVGQASLRHARRAGEVTLQCAAAGVLALAHLLVGHGVQPGLLELALNGPGDGGPLAFASHLPAAAALQYTDQFDRARALLERHQHLVRTRRTEVQFPLLAWQLTVLELRTGRWDAAERVAQDAVAGARARGNADGLALTLTQRSQVHALRDRVDAARDDLQEATEVMDRTIGLALRSVITASTVVLETCLDNPSGVHAVAGPLVAAVRPTGPTDPAMLGWVPDEVEALLALGQHDVAAEVLAWYESLCRRTGRRSGHAAVARCRAQVAALAGHHDEAMRLALVSAQEFARLGLPFARARALLVAGRIQRRHRQKRAALDLLTEATTIFEQLGAPAWVERCRGELARVGIRGAARDGNGLTAAEHEVAALVAQGLTNRETGAALFMSHRTVEAHLTRIYASLGIRSRSELAARVAAGRAPVVRRTSPSRG